jgi:hypothetical protein
MGAARSKSNAPLKKEKQHPTKIMPITVIKANGSAVLIHLDGTQNVRAIKEATSLREGIRGSQQQLYIADGTRMATLM